MLDCGSAGYQDVGSETPALWDKSNIIPGLLRCSGSSALKHQQFARLFESRAGSTFHGEEE